MRDGDSLLGRAGLALNHQRTWNDATGIVRSDVYGIANLRYEFLNGTNVDVAGIGFANAQDRLWGSIGGGGTYSWANGRYAVFGEVSYNASLDNSSDNRNYKGTGGFRLHVVNPALCTGAVPAGPKDCRLSGCVVNQFPIFCRSRGDGTRLTIR